MSPTAKFLLLLVIALTTSITDTNAQKRKSAPTTDTLPLTQLSALSFRNIGPFRGGRSAAVTGVPNKPNLYYFGAAGGGIWRTEDGGRQWENISDGYFGGSIGAIAVSEDDPGNIAIYKRQRS